jgi:hypothetical protein
MNNASAYIGLIRERKIGIVIPGNRGGTEVEEVGRRIHPCAGAAMSTLYSASAFLDESA